MSTTVRMTADELLGMPDDGFRYELVRGELRRMSPAGNEHSILAMRIGIQLGVFAQTHRLGVVGGADCGYKLSPDTVRAPDASFIRRERIPTSGPPKGFFAGAPDLAVEVISPHDTFTELNEKTAEYLTHGTRLVWVLDPGARTLTIHRPDRTPRILAEQDEIDGEDVLPGFRLALAELFVW